MLLLRETNTFLTFEQPFIGEAIIYHSSLKEKIEYEKYEILLML